MAQHPARAIAFIRVTNCFAPGRLLRAHRTLRAWATSQNLEVEPLLGISHDDPEVTPPRQCRFDLAFEVGPSVSGSGHVHVRNLPAMQVLELRVRGDVGAVERAWQAVFATLPSSGFEPGNAPAIERYLKAPDFESWSGFDVVLALPVVPDRSRS